MANQGNCPLVETLSICETALCCFGGTLEFPEKSNGGVPAAASFQRRSRFEPCRLKNGLTGILVLNGIEIDTALVTAAGQVRYFLKCYE